jgi:hypothetical protein
LPTGTKQIAVGMQMRAGTGTSYFDNIKLQKGDFRYQLGYDTAGNYITSIDINIKNDPDNLVELENHRGRHTDKYHQEIRVRLDQVYGRYGGTDKLEEAVRKELERLKQELLDGILDPYGK